MGDFLESAKNLVNSTVSRTSWEAQKQLRIRGKQKEIDKLLEQRQKLTEELCLTAMTLYEQGTLADTQLSRLCASVFELDHDLRSHEQQLQEAKSENYPVEQFAPAPTTNYAPPPVSPTPANPVQPTPSQPAQPYRPSKPNVSSGYRTGAGTNAQGQSHCPQCGSPVRAKSAYCRDCGAKLS
jgi:hypothetical protein